MLLQDGTEHLSWFYYKKNTIQQSTCGQLDVFWVNFYAWWNKMDKQLKIDDHCSQEKHVTHFHHQRPQIWIIKESTISLTQFTINCTFLLNFRSMIFQIIGTPDDITYITDDRAKHYLKSFGKVEKTPFKSIFNYLPAEIEDFL